MSNVNHDDDNDVQRGLYGEEAQALANKIAGSTVAIVGGEHSQLKTLKQVIIESQGNSETLVITREVSDMNKKVVYVNLFNRIEKLRN